MLKYINTAETFRNFAALSVCGDNRNRKAVIAFAADRLDRRGAHARFGGEQFIEPARALDIRIVAGDINDRNVR